MLLAILFILTLFPMPANAHVQAPGDVNGDGVINVKDAVLAMRYIIGLQDLDDKQVKAADVNNDGTVNVQDVSLILKNILGLIDDFEKPAVSTYKISYSLDKGISPVTHVYGNDIYSAQDYVYADITLETVILGKAGYDDVRFAFEAEGNGDVTFRGKDIENKDYEFVNQGYWGPDSGFDLPPLYKETYRWAFLFAEPGEYKIIISLIKAPDGDVIADISRTIRFNINKNP